MPVMAKETSAINERNNRIIKRKRIEHSLLRIEFINEITGKFEEETKFEDIDAENDRK